MTEIIVIGGGLAGAAAAIGLAQAGKQVRLFDKASGPQHKVCGEFLSGEAVDYLGRLGIDVAALGGVPIDRVSLQAGTRTSKAKLPFPAWSLSRCRLDAALLARAEACGADVQRAAIVQALEPGPGGWTIRLHTGEQHRARDIFLATGKHDLRGHKRPPGRQNDLVAFKMYYRLPMPATVELILFPGGYAGLEPVEDGIANLCLVLQRQRLARLGGTWEGVLAHLAATAAPLAEKLSIAQPLWEKPLTITAIPYGLVQDKTEPGLWRLGDQAAVIPSFSGDGMSIALHSAATAVRDYLAGRSAPASQRTLAGQLRGQVARATMISQALVHPAGQIILPCLAGLFPVALAVTARSTRIKSEYRLSSGKI
jgi:flavin-dependent dehydrogenase